MIWHIIDVDHKEDGPQHTALWNSAGDIMAKPNGLSPIH